MTLAILKHRVMLKPLELNHDLVNSLKEASEDTCGFKVEDENGDIKVTITSQRKAEKYLEKLTAPAGLTEEKTGATNEDSMVLKPSAKIVHGKETKAEVICTATQTWAQLAPKLISHVEKVFRDTQPKYVAPQPPVPQGSELNN